MGTQNFECSMQVRQVIFFAEKRLTVSISSCSYRDESATARGERSIILQLSLVGVEDN